MDTQEAIRKPFPVKVVQVTLENVEEVTQWCNGTIEQRDTRLLGTMTKLPVVLFKGLANKPFEAALGCWVVELNGTFRSYKPSAFDATFDLLPKEETPAETEADEQIAEDSGIYNSGFRLVENDPEHFQKIV